MSFLMSVAELKFVFEVPEVRFTLWSLYVVTLEQNDFKLKYGNLTIFYRVHLVVLISSTLSAENLTTRLPNPRLRVSKTQCKKEETLILALSRIF